MWVVKIKGTHGLSMRAESGGFYWDWVMLKADWGSVIAYKQPPNVGSRIIKSKELEAQRQQDAD